MRIIAGSAKGRRLVAPQGTDTRPTPDRVREALFSIIVERVPGARVLDLFAGTGALGLEALSRGAAEAVFVEKARPALAALTRNLEVVAPGVAGTHELLAVTAERAMTQLQRYGRRFDLVFLDPPYAKELLAPTLVALVEHNLLLPCALVVCEHHGRDDAPRAPAQLAYLETRHFGDVALSLFELSERTSALSTALYPGSFDPVTYGHLNIVERGLKVFDRLVVSVAINPKKSPLFSPEERIEMIREAVGGDPRIEVESFHGLLVEYATRRGASVILRGLRAISDFEFEFQMAHMNRRLNPQLETVFMMTGEDHFFVSSQLVREIAAFGGDLKGLVPANVERRLRARFSARERNDA